MKTCSVCEETKTDDHFYKDRGMPDGLRKSCKSCKNRKTAEWRVKNRVKYNADMRAYNKKHYDRLRIMRYNLVPAEHAKMLEAQGGKCAICRKTPKTLRPLNIDHDHKTDKVRGLLCAGCNRLMVLLDDPELYAAALKYKRLGT